MKQKTLNFDRRNPLSLLTEWGIILKQIKLKNSNLLLILLMGLSLALNAQTVTIGTQVWMSKNLDVATFRNGDTIPQAKTNEEWVKAGENKQPAWCYYENDPANGTKYGKLYNWYAVNDPRGLEPAGYHIPSDAEWDKLKNFLGSDAGKKMKSTSGWNSITTGGVKTCPKCVSWSAEYRRKVACHTCKDKRIVSAPKITKSGNGTNSCGFSGLPGGSRDGDGTFRGVGESGGWWSSTEGSTEALVPSVVPSKETGKNLAWRRFLFYKRGDVGRGYGVSKAIGFSVRCLRD